MAKVKLEESNKMIEILSKKEKENYIIKEVELRKDNSRQMKKQSVFLDEMDEEWEDFITRRKAEIPPLPKVEHHGGHGHHSGPID